MLLALQLIFLSSLNTSTYYLHVYPYTSSLLVSCLPD